MSDNTNQDIDMDALIDKLRTGRWLTTGECDYFNQTEGWMKRIKVFELPDFEVAFALIMHLDYVNNLFSITFNTLGIQYSLNKTHAQNGYGEYELKNLSDDRMIGQFAGNARTVIDTMRPHLAFLRHVQRGVMDC